MFGYYYYCRSTGLLATLTFCAVLAAVACAESSQPVSRGHSPRDHTRLRLLLHEKTKDALAGLDADALRSISAARLVGGGGDLSQEQLHSSPHQRRRTQSSCAESSPIDITSSLSSDVEGCYYQTEVDAGDGLVEIIYTPSGGPEVGQWWMHPDGLVSNGIPLQGVYWWLSFATAVDEEGFVTSSEDLCHSNQAATSYTPADVISWQCGPVFSVVSDDEFSVACGGSCTTDASTLDPSPAPPVVETTVAPTTKVTGAPTATLEAITTPSPAAVVVPERTPGPTPGSRGLETPAPTVPVTPDGLAPAPEPEASTTPGPALETPEPTDSTTTTPEGTCAESSPFEITSSLYPNVEGCYFQTEVAVEGGVEIVYTPSGGPEVEQWWMHPDGLISNGIPLQGAYWWLSFATAVDEEGSVTSSEDLCKSNQAATSYTPADVISWGCGATLDTVSADEFSIACGGSCNGPSTPTEPEPSPTPPAVETVEPTEIETPAPTVAETPESTEPPTPNTELASTPAPVAEAPPTPSPATALVSEDTPAPTAGNQGLETRAPIVSSPESPDSAELAPGDTPAPFGDLNDGEVATSAGNRRVSWSVFQAGIVASVATVAALL